MRRRHLFELTDQPWLPAAYRDMLTDYLQAATELGDPYRCVVARLAEAIERSGSPGVVDLCAGAGGPWARLRPALEARLARPLSVTLTDAFPHAPPPGGDPAGIERYGQPVDARRVPAGLAGFRTIFAGLHHFRPSDAQAILADAARSGMGIGVFEGTERSARGLLAILLAPLLVLLLTPRIRPFRWSRLLFTYIIPIVPLGVLFDGLVSCLRTYTPAELRALAEASGVGGYSWEAGSEPIPGAPLAITYLIGRPASAGDAEGKERR